MKHFSPFSVIFLTVFATLLLLPSCSKHDNFDKIPHTGFITHYQHSENNRTPFLSYWAHGNAEVWDNRVQGKKGQKQVLYIKDINIGYMDAKSSKNSAKKDLDTLRDYFRESLRKNILTSVQGERNFIPQAHPSANAYTLEIAIISITPTHATANLLLSSVNNIKSGIGTVGGQLLEKGHIAIAAKLSDEKGRVIAEMADYREDHSALLIDLKDFTRYKHHEKHIDEWCKEITLLITHPSNYKVDPPRKFTLNPF